jgi:Protein of unknown function (DUF3558)
MRLLALVALATAAIAVTACGGDAKPPAAPGSPQRPLVGKQPTPGGGTAGGRRNEAAAPAKAKAPGYDALLDAQSSHPRSRFTPCNLVTEKQAQAILGAPLQDPVEAAQGPTCIYRSKDGRSFVTLAVQSLDFAKLKPRLRVPRRVTVGARTAYCGTYGQPMLYVPLSSGRVLSVAGRCEVARRFATRAVRQL